MEVVYTGAHCWVCWEVLIHSHLQGAFFKNLWSTLEPSQEPSGAVGLQLSITDKQQLVLQMATPRSSFPPTSQLEGQCATVDCWAHSSGGTNASVR